ncbi:MAG TPA: FAD-binding oxidoreductase [Methylomirabilota bacterium]|nr:FAD-binding oxidoreductase [Methylomirabilota bacterium]
MPKAPSCRARVAAIGWLDPVIIEADLAMVDPPELAFEAGQWIAIPLDAKTVRPYSMASPPSERRQIRLCVDVKPGGLGSRYFRDLRVGDEVAFQPPLGTLTLIKDSLAPVLLVAEEIGVVPFSSILLDQAERGFPRPMTLHFTAPTVGHLLYDADFRALAAVQPRFRYRPLLSAADPAGTGEVGSVVAAIERDADAIAGHDVLLCGGGALVKAARDWFLARGVERKRIRYEKFW